MINFLPNQTNNSICTTSKTRLNRVSLSPDDTQKVELAAIRKLFNYKHSSRTHSRNGNELRCHGTPAHSQFRKQNVHPLPSYKTLNCIDFSNLSDYNVRTILRNRAIPRTTTTISFLSMFHSHPLSLSLSLYLWFFVLHFSARLCKRAFTAPVRRAFIAPRARCMGRRLYWGFPFEWGN